MEREKFDLSGFSKRLKEVAKTEFGGVGKLGELANIQNMAIYTQQKAREPRATILFNLATAGVDINYLLTGDRTLLNKEIDSEITRLKARMFDLIEEMERVRKEGMKS